MFHLPDDATPPTTPSAPRHTELRVQCRKSVLSSIAGAVRTVRAFARDCTRAFSKGSVPPWKNFHSENILLKKRVGAGRGGEINPPGVCWVEPTATSEHRLLMIHAFCHRSSGNSHTLNRFS